MTVLWRFNSMTGLWVYERTCSLENALGWLKLFQDDEPNVKFKLSKTRPAL